MLSIIPSSEANVYYQLSLDASNKIITEGGFTLFNKYPDPSQNYYRLFVDETEDETIFMKVWLPFEKGHSYDLRNTPYSYRVDWGSSMSPSKQLMDSYEVLSTGLLPSESGSGYDPENPFENRDPRFKGTLLTNNDLFQGSGVETWYATERDGVIDTNTGTGIGKDGMGVHPDATKTGAYVRKYLADGPSPLLIQQYYSGQDVQMEVFNLNGGLVKTKRIENISNIQEQLSLGSFPNGFYYLLLRLEDGTSYSTKLVKIKN